MADDPLGRNEDRISETCVNGTLLPTAPALARDAANNEDDDDDAPPIELESIADLPRAYAFMLDPFRAELSDGTSERRGAVHYYCNLCEGPIPDTALRYRCWQCWDWDQCAACTTREQHPHPLTLEPADNEILRRKVVQAGDRVRDVLEKMFQAYSGRPALGYRALMDPPEASADSKTPRSLAPRYTWITYAQLAERVRLTAAVLHWLLSTPNSRPIFAASSLPVERSVCIAGTNRIDWVVADQACFLANIVSVPLHVTSSLPSLLYSLSLANAEILICSIEMCALLFPVVVRVLALQAQPSGCTTEEDRLYLTSLALPHPLRVRYFLLMRENNETEPTVVGDDDAKALLSSHLSLLSSFSCGPDQVLPVIFSLSEAQSFARDRSLSPPPPPVDFRGERIVTVCFTSGSTGRPKGVMLSDATFRREVASSIYFPAQVRRLSFQPMSHTSDRLSTTTLLVQGGQVGLYSGDVGRIFEDCQCLSPSTFSAPPRFWNSLYQRYMQELSALRDQEKTKSLGARDVVGSVPSPLEAQAATERKIERALRQKYHKMLGLNISSVSTGSAPVLPHVLRWMGEVWGSSTEGYGTSESGSIAQDSRVLSSVDVKLVEIDGFSPQGQPPRGEICVKTERMFSGYLGDADATRAAFTSDGYYRTGDIGELIDGNIRVLCRKGAVVKKESGEFINIEEVERAWLLHLQRELSQLRDADAEIAAKDVFVTTVRAVAASATQPKDSRDDTLRALHQMCLEGAIADALVGIVVVNLDSAVGSHRAAAAQPVVSLHAPTFTSLLSSMATSLPSGQRPIVAAVVDDEWTADNDLLTPSCKVKRPSVSSRYLQNFVAYLLSLSNPSLDLAGAAPRSEKPALSESSIPSRSLPPSLPKIVEIVAVAVSLTPSSLSSHLHTPIVDLGADSVAIAHIHASLGSVLPVPVPISYYYSPQASIFSLACAADGLECGGVDETQQLPAAAAAEGASGRPDLAAPSATAAAAALTAATTQVQQVESQQPKSSTGGDGVDKFRRQELRLIGRDLLAPPPRPIEPSSPPVAIAGHGSESEGLARLFSLCARLSPRVSHGSTASVPLSRAVSEETSSSGSLSTEPVAQNVILLTGCPGFLGVHLLLSLLLLAPPTTHVIATVRPRGSAPRSTLSAVQQPEVTSDMELARIRLEKALDYFCLSHLLCPVLCARLHILPSNIADPLLSLTESDFLLLARHTRSIVHAAAHVHHHMPYSHLRADNVLSTRHLISLALSSTAGARFPLRQLPHFHYVSSLSVLSFAESYSMGETYAEDARLAITIPASLSSKNSVHLGYSATKWVSEIILEAAADKLQLPVSIHRAGCVTASQSTGAANHEAWIHRLIRGCSLLGAVPELPLHTSQDLIPVDICADRIAILVLRSELRHQPKQTLRARDDGDLISMRAKSTSIAKYHHTAHAHAGGAADLMKGLLLVGRHSRPMAMESYPDWVEHVRQAIAAQPGHPLAPTFSTFTSWGYPMTTLASTELTDRHVAEALRAAGLGSLPVSDAAHIVDRYLNWSRTHAQAD